MDDFSVEESRQILENLKRQSEGWFHMQWDLKDTQSCRQNKDVSQLKNLDHSQVVFGLLTTHFKLDYGSKSVLSDSKCEDKFPSWGNLLGVDFSLDGASDRVISPFTTSHWSLLHTDTLTLPSVKLNFMTPPPPPKPKPLTRGVSFKKTHRR